MKKECNKKNGLFHVIYDLSYYTSMFKELYMHTITAIRTINASNRAFKIAKRIFLKVKTQKEKKKQNIRVVPSYCSSYFKVLYYGINSSP